MTLVVISLGFTVLLGILSLIFKVGAKLRLTLPILYFLAAVVSTFFTDWTTQNEQSVLYGLYILIGLVALSWIYSFIKTIKNKSDERTSEEALTDYINWQIQKAREIGIDINTATFDENGHMRDKVTGQQIQL